MSLAIEKSILLFFSRKSVNNKNNNIYIKISIQFFNKSESAL